LRTWLSLLLCMLLLTACTPRALYSAYQQRSSADEDARGADAMALVTVGDTLPSYEMDGTIFSDTHVSVIRGRKVEPGARITLRRHGGAITVPGSNIERVMHVDYTYSFPAKGGEGFLLLRRVGEKYEIIDAMPLVGGRPAYDSPTNQVYLPYLKSLK
jgi:hypothetical protein